MPFGLNLFCGKSEGFPPTVMVTMLCLIQLFLRRGGDKPDHSGPRPFSIILNVNSSF